MPLGDSLTAGGYNIGKVWQIDGGYREHLWRYLQPKDIEFVGSRTNGNFASPFHEGYSGWKIHEVGAIAADAVVNYRPDIVLLMLGSNDLFRNFQVS